MSERLRQRIDALRVEYVKTFGEEVAGFEVSLEQNDRSSISQRAHRIAGTAGSYQLDDVCGAAQEVERLCGLPLTEPDGLTLEVKRLCSALEAASQAVLQAAT